MKKTLARTRKYFNEEDIEIDVSTPETVVECFNKISLGSYARGELSALIWLSDSTSLSDRGRALIKWRMEALMDCLDGKLTYEQLVDVCDFCD